MHSKIVLLMAVLALPPVMKAAGDAPLDRATLRGLGSLGVIIDPIDPELAKEGLTQDLLQKRIEGRLRDAGIAVDPSAPEFVGLRILQVRAQKGSFAQRPPYALCLSVGVYQPVVLVRNKDVKTATETWAVDTVLMADPKVVSREALNSVDELADRLIAAYRSANPKTSR
jgi:hypothetical protein